MNLSSTAAFSPGTTAKACLVGLALLLILGTYLSNRGSQTRLIRRTATFRTAIPTFDSNGSQRESFDYYDLPQWDWKQRTERVWRQREKQALPKVTHRHGAAYFQDNWEPEWSCDYEERIGSEGDGGKWVCDPDKITSSSTKPCLVYSFGSNYDTSFEQAMYNRTGCEIHTFDHTVNILNPPKGVVFHQWGLGNAASRKVDRSHMKNGTVYNLQSIIAALGHEDRGIDVFKIDIEGHEYGALTGIFRASASGSKDLEHLLPIMGIKRLPMRQILVEVHFRAGDSDEFLRQVTNAGYVIFHKEPNTYGCRGKCIEYALLQLNLPS